MKRSYRTYHLEGMAVEPVAFASLPGSPIEGQIAIVTDRPGQPIWIYQNSTWIPSTDSSIVVLSEIATQEDITIEVDYVLGTRPTTGTTVTTQAEADAVSPVKYCQDVIDVLPPFVDHIVTASLVAGDHYAPPDLLFGGYSGVFIHFSELYKTQKALPPAGYYSYSNARVRFIGATSDIETGVDGILASSSFTRNAGTWVVDELAGKWLDITAGASAGSKALVASNTETVATLLNYYYSTGVATVTAFDVASLLHISNGTNHLYYFCAWNSVDGSPSGNLWAFQNLQLGTITDGMEQAYLPDTWMQECRIVPGGFSMVLASTIAYYRNIAAEDTTLTALNSGRLNIDGLLSTGTPPNSYLLGIFDASDPYVELNNVFMQPTGASAWALGLHGGSRCRVVGPVTIEGDGLAGGLLTETLDSAVPGLENFDKVTINNCAVGVGIKLAARIVLEAPSGLGNIIGWEIDGGSELHATNPENIGATTEIQIDGLSVNYTELANSGDTITGPHGSSIMRR